MTEHSKQPEDRGHCRACKWWEAEHEGPTPDDATIGLCMQPDLTHFSLQVSGHSGCNHFEPAAENAGPRPASVYSS